MIGVFGAELDLYLQETFGFLALTDESRAPCTPERSSGRTETRGEPELAAG